MSILVSVYCLTYNHEKYIRKALEGFVNQKTDFEYEVFVYDDASTDTTASIIQELAEWYPGIIKPMLKKENQFSKNVPIFEKYVYPYMAGKYIAMCEGDDYWCDEHKLQKQVDFLEKHSNYIACTHNSFVYNQTNGEKKLFSSKMFCGLVKTKEIIEWKKNIFHRSSLMYRRSVGFPTIMRNINNMGDLNLTLWLGMNGKIYYMNTPMSVYRLNGEGSWTLKNQNQDMNALNQIEALKLFDKESKSKYTRIVHKQINRLNIEILYRNNKIDKICDIGYIQTISAGCIGIAVSVFLQQNNYRLYQVISKFLYGKREK